MENIQQTETKTVQSDPLLAEFYCSLGGNKNASPENAIPNEEQTNELNLKPDESETNASKGSAASLEQIQRLLRPGATYFNLNPFEVLQVDYNASLDEIKKKYRKLSVLVHPDKNTDNIESAQQAFEAVNRAFKMLEDDKERRKCVEVVEEAKERLNISIEEKRKKLRKESKSKSEPTVQEDDPEHYAKALWSMTCKLFADIERLRIREEMKKAEERKRKAEERTEEDERLKVKREWDKNYEASRDDRVSSWKSFQTKKKTQTGNQSCFKPPKHKPENRG